LGHIIYPVTGGYGRSGVPDIIGCYKGKFIAIECKAGNGKTTALQDKNIDAIRAQNGRALVVNEENISDVIQLLIDIQNGI
jgi:Holliday junction resolvase